MFFVDSSDFKQTLPHVFHGLETKFSLLLFLKFVFAFTKYFIKHVCLRLVIVCKIEHDHIHVRGLFGLDKRNALKRIERVDPQLFVKNVSRPLRHRKLLLHLNFYIVNAKVANN